MILKPIKPRASIIERYPDDQARRKALKALGHENWICRVLGIYIGKAVQSVEVRNDNQTQEVS